MIICHCLGTKRSTIIQCLRRGEDPIATTHASIQCGGCYSAIQQIIKEHQMKPEISFEGTRNNSFIIFSLCYTAAMQAGWSTEEWATFKEEALQLEDESFLELVNRHFTVKC